MTTRLALKFKGGRDYLHGTDMYNAISDLITHRYSSDDISDLDISFYGLAKTSLTLAPFGEMDKSLLRAVYAFSVGGARTKLGAYETGEQVTERYPYPEDQIVADMTYDDDSSSATLADASGYSDIEIWVAMIKAMHHRFVPEAKGKWLFARGQFPRYTNRTVGGLRQIMLVANMGNKLTRTRIIQDGTDVGLIYFANA